MLNFLVRPSAWKQATAPSESTFFFCASLPHLQRAEKAPIDSATFLRQAETVLEQVDYRFLAELTFDSCRQLSAIEGPLHDYFQWEIALRNRVAAQHHAVSLSTGLLAAQEWTGELTLVLGGVGVGVEALLQECLALDPLQAEQRLLAARWERLDLVKGIHQFDLVALAVYRLQLLLLEVQQCWQHEQGKQRYHDACQTILRRDKGSFA